MKMKEILPVLLKISLEKVKNPHIFVYINGLRYEVFVMKAMININVHIWNVV
ncbi:hypothetical protein BLA29_013082 [Euroglyphus maynei]|uniref:Uncharacterized protein n=1 Tax=Euroglyphus maynei TaxID=6958 RepID=A0A1Y3AWI4_EURMA|nr:hypothetical protein BLA29_013082 [Euroglyphus maynei]